MLFSYIPHQLIILSETYEKFTSENCHEKHKHLSFERPYYPGKTKLDFSHSIHEDLQHPVKIVHVSSESNDSIKDRVK